MKKAKTIGTKEVSCLLCLFFLLLSVIFPFIFLCIYYIYIYIYSFFSHYSTLCAFIFIVVFWATFLVCSSSSMDQYSQFIHSFLHSLIHLSKNKQKNNVSSNLKFSCDGFFRSFIPSLVGNCCPFPWKRLESS